MEVPLHGERGRGKFVLLDPFDYERIQSFTGKWSIAGTGYVQVWDRHKKGVFLLHRIIMGHPPHQVDHINGNKLDCRRENLRATPDTAIHARNKKPRNPGRFGVTWAKREGKWMARITVDKKGVFLGYYTDIDDARRAVRKATLEQDPLLVERFSDEWSDL